MKELVVASENQGKILEIQDVLSSLDMEVIPAADKGFSQEIQETGTTLEENALLKASLVSSVLKLPVLADDSGLEVLALHGAPGVYSARFAGPNATDAQNNEKLLRLLEGVEEGGRKAWFRTVLALVIPGKTERFFQGRCDGFIAFKPQGESGFGYDPVFVVPSYGRTLAQLGLQIKNRISHRALALQELKGYLLQMHTG